MLKSADSNNKVKLMVLTSHHPKDVIGGAELQAHMIAHTMHKFGEKISVQFPKFPSVP